MPHTNKRKRVEEIQRDLVPTIYEVSLNYIKEGNPSLLQQCMDVSHEVERLFLRWEMDMEGNVDYVRYNRYMDQVVPAMVSVYANLAAAIGQTRKGGDGLQKMQESHGSLTECLVWIEFFPEEMREVIRPMLERLLDNFNDFMEAEDAVMSATPKRQKKKDNTEYDPAYLRASVPEIIGKITKWTVKVHQELAHHISEFMKGQKWGSFYLYKHHIESLCYALATAPANMMEGWGRAGGKQNWNYLRVGRAAMYKMLAPLEILPGEFSGSILGEWKQLMKELDEYVEDVLTAIVQNKRPQFLENELALVSSSNGCQ